MERLVFWDIDRTLIVAGGVALDYFGEAMLATTGVPLRHTPDFAGRTDRAIISETLALHEIEVTEALLERFYAEMAARAAALDPLMRAQGRALPGALAALAALAELPGVVQSVVTGNVEAIARQKLAAFGLDTHVDFEIGGYGTHSAIRADLLALALERAHGKHTPAPGWRAVVIGDTPHDVVAAKAHGALAIAVATGRFTADELAATGADVVMESLSDTAAVLAAVGVAGFAAAHRDRTQPA